MTANMDYVPTPSSSNTDELSDPTFFYADFLQAVNATRKKLAEVDDNISSLNSETGATTMEALTLFDPKILSYLHDIEIKGRQMDKLVATTQEMKNNLLKLVDETTPVDHYKTQLEALGLLGDV